METEIGLFAMKRDMINRSLQHFKEVGVEVHVVQMAPLALCNFVAYDLLNKEAPPSDGEEEAPARRTASSPWTSAPTTPTWSSPTATRSSGNGPSRSAATTSPAP